MVHKAVEYHIGFFDVCTCRRHERGGDGDACGQIRGAGGGTDERSAKGGEDRTRHIRRRSTKV